MMSTEDALEQALRELSEFAHDPHREHLLQKFPCKESRQLSELLGVALQRDQAYSQPRARGGSLPVPAGLVHPG